MTVVYNGTLRNTRLQDVATAIDAGGAPAVLRLLSGGGTVLSSLSLSRPCGTVAGQVLTFAALTADPAAVNSGTATAARIDDSNGSNVISGLTVSSAAGSDIILTPTATIVAGQAVQITSATISGN